MLIAIAGLGALFVLWLLFSTRSPLRQAKDQTAEQLRTLLLARANGRLTEDEFNQHQAALHAAVLLPTPARKHNDGILGVLALIVVIVASTYAWRTKPQAIEIQPTVLDNIELTPAGPMDTHIGNAPQPPAKVGGDLSVVVKRLADKMAKNPGDGEGWLLLARTYSELNQMQEAATAYAKAAALLPPNAALFADWANTHVLANAGKWDAESKKIIQRALAADAKHPKSLSLAGSEAFSRADYKTAIAYWQKELSASTPNTDEAKLAQSNIQEAQMRLSGKTSQAAAPASTAISGTVTLDATLKGKVSPGDTLFIVARAPDGSNPPLAVKRFTAADLPVHFSLDDSAAMIPSRTLSQFSEITLIARISKSGLAAPAAGDIEAKPVSTKMGNTGIKLQLSSVR